ncbi:MAG: T9SS type A sorting domain-containing protein [Bacteroidales bacterium]|nr:T9SS type A sorting domain-containing protein [Bacteroidales bacterium]
MRIFTILYIALFFFYCPVSGQYVIDFDDCQTFQTTCGSVGSSQWIVKNERCSLIIPDLVMQDLSGNYVVPFTFTINQSGNLEFEDSLALFHQVNSGPWGIDTVIHGNGITSVREITDSFFLAFHDTVRFILQLETDNVSEFWSIKSGDIAIENAEPVLFLPVELISFDAQYFKEENEVQIDWTTASETNSSHFVLSRSLDVENFEDIAWLPAAGNSAQMLFYQITDHDIPETPILFYSLRQYDLDGALALNEIISVEIHSSANQLMVYSDNNQFMLILDNYDGGVVIIEVLSIQGQCISRQEVPPLTNIFMLNTSMLKDGSIYFISCLSNSGRESKKIVF